MKKKIKEDPSFFGQIMGALKDTAGKFLTKENTEWAMGKLFESFKAGDAQLAAEGGRRLHLGRRLPEPVTMSIVMGKVASTMGPALLNGLFGGGDGGDGGDNECSPPKLIDEYSKCTGTSFSDMQRQLDTSGRPVAAKSYLVTKTKEAVESSNISTSFRADCTAVDMPPGTLWQLTTSAVSPFEDQDVKAKLCIYCWTPDGTSPIDPPGQGACNMADCRTDLFKCDNGNYAKVEAAKFGHKDLMDCGADAKKIPVQCLRGMWQRLDTPASGGSPNAGSTTPPPSWPPKINQTRHRGPIAVAGSPTMRSSAALFLAAWLTQFV